MDFITIKLSSKVVTEIHGIVKGLMYDYFNAKQFYIDMDGGLAGPERLQFWKRKTQSPRGQHSVIPREPQVW